MQRHPYLSSGQSVGEQLCTLRKKNNLSVEHISLISGVTCCRVNAIEHDANARLSTVLKLFNTLGYDLYPVPKRMMTEVAIFVASGGMVVVKPAGEEAPMNERLAQFKSYGREQDDNNDSDEEF